MPQALRPQLLVLNALNNMERLLLVKIVLDVKSANMELVFSSISQGGRWLKPFLV